MNAKKIIGNTLIVLFYLITVFFIVIYGLFMYTIFLGSWIYGKFTGKWAVYTYIDDHLVPVMFH